MSSLTCDRCGKECKDKRGLALHLKKCEGVKDLGCEYCNQVFANPYSLSVHLTRCKSIKVHKELTAKEEIASLQSELQQSKVEIARLLCLQQEMKDKMTLSLTSKEEQLQELELKHQKEQSDLKTSLHLDLDRQLKIRDSDLSSLMAELKSMTKDLKNKEYENEYLKENLKSITVEKLSLIDLNAKLSLKDNNNTMIINQQNDNRIQLHCLDGSMIRGRIHPPDYSVGSVSDLMGMLRSLGIRNCFRVNDRSRGTLSWNKPGEGEVRDPTGDQMLSHIIDVLTPDITYEKCYYEDELKKLFSSHDPDVYQINVYNTFIKFCSDLLKKDPELINDIKRELVKQGKAKNDNEVDQVCEISYSKFVTSISLALFPNVMSWINFSFYELGRYIGTHAKDYYHIEGASREMRYIVIHSNGNSHLQVKSSKLMTFIKEAIESIIDREIIERILENILLHKASDIKQMETMIRYLKTPTFDETEEIMRGIVSL